MVVVESRLAEFDYILPPPPEPIGNYLSATSSGNIMWLTSVGSRRADGSHTIVKLGEDLTVEQGYEAAQWCALNLLARKKTQLGDLDRVARILKVFGMVNCSPGFEDQAKVLDGASDLFVELFGQSGKHSRSGVGLAVLPRNTAVMIDCVIEFTEI